MPDPPVEFVTHLTDSQEYFSQFLFSVELFSCDNIRLTSLYCFCKLAAIALSFVGSIFVLGTDIIIVWPLRPFVRLSFLFLKTAIMKPC